MRIIQGLGWYFPDSLGGTEAYVATLSQCLRRAGHDVLIAAPLPGGTARQIYTHEGIPVFRYPIAAQQTRDECQGRVPVRGADRFHTWVREQRPDIVHFQTLVPGMSLPEVKAAKATGACIIATTHSSSLGFICQRGTMMRWGESLCDGVCIPRKCAACELQHRGLPEPLARLTATMPLALARCARRLPGKVGTGLGMGELIVHNQAQQKELLATVDMFVLLTRWGFEAVVANGAPRTKLALNRLGCAHSDLQRKPGPSQQPTGTPIRVGYLGRLDPIKGVHDLARAIAAVQHDVPFSVEFRGPITNERERVVAQQLRAIVADDPRVTFASAVQPHEVGNVLSSYDVLCCPSVCLEGGPTVAIEAHAVGTPVVGTRIGGLAEMITDGVNGRLVPPGDWRALAVVLREMASAPAQTIDRWRAALPPVRTMDDVAAEYLSLYAESIGGAAGRS